MAFFQFVIFCFLGLLFALPSHAKIYSDNNCAQYRQEVDNAIDDAEKLAQAAVDSLSAQSRVRDAKATESLFASLFNDADLHHIRAVYQNIANLRNDARADVTIYCSEEGLIDFPKPREGDTAAYFRFLGFGNERRRVVPHTLISADDPNLRGKSPCKLDKTTAYTINSWRDDIKLSAIILCPSFFAKLPGKDPRRVAEMRENHLLDEYAWKKDLWYLTDMRPLGSLLLHEYCHLRNVGGVDKDENMLIGDGPDRNTYGFTKCLKLNAAGPGRTNFVADTYALFSLGNYFKLSKTRSVWATGAVTVDGTGRYIAYVPPASNPQSKKRRLEAPRQPSMARGKIRR